MIMKIDRITQSHPLQSPAWGEFRRAMGIDTVGVNGWQLTFHRIPYSPWTIGYFPKGPEPDRSMIDDLTKLGKEKNAIFIQIEPNVFKNSELRTQNPASPAGRSELIPSHHPLFTKYTFVLDLTKTEEELLSAMHPKTRYNIRVAQKHGVTINEDNSPDAFAAYLDLSEQTTSRQGFYAHNRTYHETMWRVLQKANMAHLFTATYRGKTLAAWVIFVYGDTIYYPYGSSSRQHHEVMAPSLMLWEIARWAKARKLKRFDLWGAIGPNPDPKDPWYGFHRFKEGFRPHLVEFVGSYDLVIRPVLYRLYTYADKLRWIILRSKR